MNDYTETAPILSVRGLSKSLGARRILKNVSFDVCPGEIFGFLGPNGSGKTTAIKLILGLLRPDAGTVTIDSHPVRTEFEQAMASVGGIVENPELYPYLSGRENLRQFARMYSPRVGDERIDELTELVGLTDRIGDPVSRYSLGMRQRLGIAQALLNRPKLLILDEPTNGLDPAGIHDLRDILKRLAHEQGVGVMISSHLLAEMDMMCDRVAILNKGEVVGVYTMPELHRAVESPDGLRYRIETATVEQVSRIVAEVGGTVEEGEEMADGTASDAVAMTVRIPRDAVKLLLRRLTETETEFQSFTPVRQSLEDAFLELIRSSENPGDAPGKAESAETPDDVPAEPRDTQDSDEIHGKDGEGQ